jgi:Camelysin metallo-endopeptidase
MPATTLRIPCGCPAEFLRSGRDRGPRRRERPGDEIRLQEVNMSTTARRDGTARKILASLGVIGAAAAVAGLGTYGSFTDSTTKVTTSVQAAILNLDLSQPSGVAAIPTTTSDFVPGDSLTRAVDLVNSGVTRLSTVTLEVTAGSSNLLTTDATNGLQLAVRRCSVPWTQTTTSPGPAYGCSGTETTLFSGPIGGSRTLASPASLNPGGKDYLVFTISLPTSAGNGFQGLGTTVNLTFTGSQAPGAPR